MACGLGPRCLWARGARTLAYFAGTDLVIAATGAGGLIGAWHCLLRLAGLRASSAVAAARGTGAYRRIRSTLTSSGTSFLLLEVGETASLAVDVLDLLLGLGVELDDLLAGWRLGGLLVV